MTMLAGMPYPQNLQTALEVEDVITRHGAVPATIAIIQGQPCIGGRRAAGISAVFVTGITPYPLSV